MKGRFFAAHFLSLVFSMVFILTNYSCKKKDGNELLISGLVRIGQTGATLDGVTVTLEKKSIQGGTYSAAFTMAATGLTDGAGQFELNFPRENFSELRIAISKQGFLTRYYSISPESITPESPLRLMLEIFEKSEVTLNVRSTPPFDAGDKLNFTFIKTEFDCNCCKSGWQTFDSVNLDTTLSCLVYGNRWLQYEVQIYNLEQDTFFRDSVYCATASGGIIDLNY